MASFLGILYLAAHLLDGSADEESWVGREGLAATLAAACIVTAEHLIDQNYHNELNAEILCSIREDIHRTILTACQGQIADLVETRPSLERCWQIAGQKTAAVYELACRIGAQLATSNRNHHASLGEYGFHLGLMIQIGDDIAGLWSRDGCQSDIARKKWSLPVAYTMEGSSMSDSKRLQDYLEGADGAPSTEETARQMIMGSGALLYLAAKAERHRLLAEEALKKATCREEARQKLIKILDDCSPLRKI
jgi:geranylgeranyl diphosphate synthase type I